MKLGKKPARHGAVKFRFRDFTNAAALPKPPRNFGHEQFIDKDDWGVLGNDNAGDCVFAGAGHETMLWSNIGQGKPARFSDRSILAAYSALTGYDPNQTDPQGNNPTDNGTDMQEAASYRRKTGIMDDDGVVHKIAAYLAIDPTNLTEHYQALWLFGAVGIGIEFPLSAMDQFYKRKTWSVVPRSRIDSGHYIPLVAKRSHLACVTWGRTQPLTTGFFGKYNDESIAYVSEEMLVNNKSPEGFDAEGLLKALNTLPTR